MRPLKASLLIAYGTLAVALLGAMFSHVWRTSRLATHEAQLTTRHSISSDTAAAPAPLELDQSAS